MTIWNFEELGGGVGGKGREIGKQRLESRNVMTQRPTFKFVGFKVCLDKL